jgi:hypothetical protein
MSRSGDKYIAADILGSIAKVYDQLYLRPCVNVYAHPYSPIYNFLSDVLYSLKWGRSLGGEAGSFITTFDEDMHDFAAHIRIDVDIPIGNYEIPAKIISRWIMQGAMVGVQCTCNGMDMGSDSFSISPDSGRFKNASSLLSKLVKHSVKEIAGRQLRLGK